MGVLFLLSNITITAKVGEIENSTKLWGYLSKL